MPDDVVKAMARKFMEAGGWVEIRDLSDGTASITAYWVTDDGVLTDIATELVANGPDIPASVEKLVRRAC